MTYSPQRRTNIPRPISSKMLIVHLLRTTYTMIFLWLPVETAFTSRTASSKISRSNTYTFQRTPILLYDKTNSKVQSSNNRRLPPPVLEYDSEYYSDYLQMDDDYLIEDQNEKKVESTNQVSQTKKKDKNKKKSNNEYQNDFDINDHENDLDMSDDFYPSSDDFFFPIPSDDYEPSRSDNNVANNMSPKNDSTNVEEDSYPFNDLFYEDDKSIAQGHQKQQPARTKKSQPMNMPMPSPILADLNPSQHEAVTSPLRSITRVIAGPGAGKTRVLTSRIAYLLYKNEDDEHEEQEDFYDEPTNSRSNFSGRILAVTFTKKAAGEMQHRLQKLCTDADAEIQEYSKNVNGNDMFGDDNSSILDSIQQEEVQSDPHHDIDNDSRAGKPAILDKVTVGTFHSICARILRRNGDYLSTLLPSTIAAGTSEKGVTSDLEGSFGIIDQSEQLRLVKECLSEKGIKLEDVSGANTRGGSIKPIQILSVISKLKESDLNIPWDENENSGNQNSPTTIKESKTATRVAREIYSLYTTKLYSSNSMDFDDLILLTRLLLIKHPEVRQNLQRYWTHILVDEFQDTSTVQLDLVKLLTTESLMIVGDSDQSIYSWRGANGVESMRDVVKAYGDINEGINGSGNENKKKSEPGEKNVNGRVNTVYLMENYRSTSNIVKAAQKIINSDSSSSRGKSFNDNSASGADVRQDMKPMRGEGPTPRVLACRDAKAEANWIVRHILSMTEGELASGDNALTPASTIAIIYRTNAQSRIIEEACVAQNLRYLVRGAAGTFYSRAEIKDCLCFLKWLYNGRDKSAMLRCFKTPSRGIGNVSMNEFIAYCEDIENYFRRQNPSKKPPTFLDVLISLSNTEENNNELPIPPESSMSKRSLNRFIPFSTQMKKLREQSRILTVSGLLSLIISTLELKAHFDSTSKTSAEFADRWSNVMELCQASERYSDDGPSIPDEQTVEPSNIGDLSELSDDPLSLSPLGNFLDDVSLLTDTSDDEATNDDGPKRVVANLMTIHAAKGMEFDAVFLVGNEEGTFPTQRAISEGEGSVELEEERRLCYVAMTRAKTHLFLTWRREVMTFFGQGFKIIEPERSRFLDTLVFSKKKKKKKIGSQKPIRNRNESMRPGTRSKTTSQNLRRKNNADTTTRQTTVPSHTLLQRSPTSQLRQINSMQPGAERNKKAPSLRPKKLIKKVKKMPELSPHMTSKRSPLPRSLQNDAIKSDMMERRPLMNSVPKKTDKMPLKKSPLGDSWEDWDPSSVKSPKVSPSRLSASRVDRLTAPELKSSMKKSDQYENVSGNKAGDSFSLDSTVIFPIGSKVVHNVHGTGIILPPPSDKSNSGTSLVRVKFGNGFRVDFPLQGSGLRRQY